MSADQLGRHAHISGRPRNYVSRKWFHRARHRFGKSVPSIINRIVDEANELERKRACQECDAKGLKWHLVSTFDGEFFCWHATVKFPAFADLDNQQQAYVVITPEDSRIVDIPELPESWQQALTDKSEWSIDER